MKKLITTIFFIAAFAASVLATPVTIAQKTFPNWRLGGSVAQLRIYSDTSFYASDGTFVAAGRIDSREVYVKADCAISGTNVTCPSAGSLIVQSTTDGTDIQRAKYVAAIYDVNGRRQIVIAVNVAIPDSLAPTTTWEQIAAANSPSPAPPNQTEFYTKAQVDGIVGGLVSSVANAEANATAAVSTANAAQSTATTAQSTANAAQSDATTALGIANANAGKVNSKFLTQDYAGNMATAISGIGATQTYLIINQDESVADNGTLPVNVTLVFLNNAKLTVAAGKTLTVNKMLDPGNTQVFAGTGTVRLMPRAVERMNVVWWGGVDTGTDKTTAFNSAIANLASNSGGVLFVPQGIWLTTGLHAIPSNTTLEGVGKHGDSTRGTIIRITGANTYIAKLSEAFRDITFRNIGFDTNTSTTASSVIIEGTAPNSANAATFENVSFRGLGTASPAQVWIKDLGGSWEVLGVKFESCIWLTPASTKSFRSDTINTGIIFEQPQFLLTTQSEAIYITAAANVLISNPSFLGANLVPNVETGDRYLTGSTTTGSKNFTLLYGLTANDIGQKLIFNGSESGYIADVLSATSGILETPAANTVASVSVELFRSTPSTTMAKSCIHLTGSHGVVEIIGSQDEGVNYFLIVDGSQQQYPISITGSNIQSRIQLNQTATIISKGNSYFSQAFEETAGNSKIVSMDYWDKTNIFYNSSGVGVELTEPRPWGVKNGAGNITSDLGFREGQLNQTMNLPLIIRHTYGEFASLPQTNLPVLAVGTAFDKPAIRYGRLDIVSDKFDFYYDIKRDAATGLSYFSGNQTGSVGYSFDGRIIKRSAVTLTSSTAIGLLANSADRFFLTPAHNATIDMGSGTDGQTITLEITTSGTTSYTLTFGSGVKNQGTLVTGTVSGKVFKLTFEHNGTYFVEISRTIAM